MHPCPFNKSVVDANIKYTVYKVRTEHMSPMLMSVFNPLGIRGKPSYPYAYFQPADFFLHLKKIDVSLAFLSRCFILFFHSP